MDNQELLKISFRDTVTGGWNSTYFDIEAGKRLTSKKPGTYSFVVLDIVGYPTSIPLWKNI